MSYEEIIIEEKIKNSIAYYSIILLIFIFWIVYSTTDNISLVVFIVFIISFLIFIIILRKFRKGINVQEKVLYGLLVIIPISLYLYVIFFSQTFSSPFFIPFYSLVGIIHKYDILLILVYFSIILIKLIVIKIYFVRKMNSSESERGESVFQFFVSDITIKKALILGIYFPLSAFIEELIYRSLLLSVFTYYLKLNLLMSIICVSIIFGLVHYSASRNWSHILSTLISSIVYSLALIQLGILYPWLFHLSTNLFVLLFYYQAKKKQVVIQ
jgi:membrane protease YdiL (CAAX protease family)